MRLLERDAELELLRGAVADAARGRGCAVLVGASAGMGKTSLVQAVAAQTHPPVRVLRAAADDLATPAPLGAVRDLALDLRGTAAGPVLAASSEVVEVGQALLAELSAPQAPALVVVEDVHWADSSTVDVLTYVLRRCAGLRAAIAVTYRDDDLDEDGPWRRALGVLTGPQIRRVRLAGLTEQAVAAVLADSGLPAREVLGATGGNPLLVREVAAAGATEPTVTIEDVALGRLTRLPGPARRLVEALSVVPGRVEREVAAALDDERALPLVERRHVLRGDDEAVWFPHELLRRAVEQSVPADERREHHARVLAVLLEGAVGDAGAARLVHHAARAGDRLELARQAPVAAREALAAYAFREAGSYLDQALAHAELLARQEHLALRTEYARVLWHLGRLAESQRQAELVLQLCDGAEDDRYAAHALISWAISSSGAERLGEALQAVRRAVALLERHGDSEDLGWTLCWAAAVTVLSSEHRAALALVGRAIEVGERLGLKGVVGHALIVRGQAELGTPDARRDIAAGIELVATTGHRSHQMWGFHELGAALLADGSLAEAAAALRRARDLAEDLQRAAWAVQAADDEAAALIGLGRWRAAEEVLRAELRRPVEDRAWLALPMASLGLLLARRGDPAARGLVEEAWRLASQGGVEIRAVSVLGPRLEEAWLTGRVEQVAAHVPAALREAELQHQWYVQAQLAVVASRAGLPVGCFEECPEPWASSLRGEHAAAAQGFARRGDRYEQALELAATGDAGDGLQALRLLDELGAAGTALLVRRGLRQRGVRAPAGPRAATRANPAGLTGRQADVLALLAEGLSDAEIAERLVLSVRTVHHHVSAILQALGVATRREAVREAAARGAAGRDAATGRVG